MHGKDKYKVCGSSYSRQGPGPVRARQVLSTELCPWLETIVMLRVLSWDHTRVRRREKHKIYLYIYQDIVVDRWHHVGTLILIAAICNHVSLPGLSPSDPTLAVLSSLPSLSVHGAERVCGLWHPCTHPTSCFSPSHQQNSWYLLWLMSEHGGACLQPCILLAPGSLRGGVHDWEGLHKMNDKEQGTGHFEKVWAPGFLSIFDLRKLRWLEGLV